MFEFTNKLFFGLLSASKTERFRRSLAFNSEGRQNCLPINSRPYQARPTLISIKSNQLTYYPFTVSINNCDGSCNTINDLYAQVCVPNKVKHMNVKVPNLVLGVNETRFSVQRESCECICRLNENGKQKWNYDECWCDCEELDDWSSCEDDYM